MLRLAFARAVQRVSAQRAPVITPARSLKSHRRKKLNRTSAHRIAMLRNMVTSLIKHERIRTTTPKAKTLRPYAERLVTYAKKSDQRHGMNLAARIVREQGALRKRFEVIGPRYATRNGGYTRVLQCFLLCSGGAATRRRCPLSSVDRGVSRAAQNRRGDPPKRVMSLRVELA